MSSVIAVWPSRGNTSWLCWRAQTPISAALRPKKSIPTTPSEPSFWVTVEAMVARSSQVHVLSSGIFRPAFSAAPG